MDLNDFWQANKRFVLTVTGGALVFLVGLTAIDSLFGGDLADVQRKKSKAETGLATPMYQSGDLTAVQAEHQSFTTALETLTNAVQFKPRPAFELGEGPAINRYLTAVADTREALVTAAGRAGVKIPDDLGMPALSPSKEQEIARYLEALDLIDRALHLAIDSGVSRVDEIHIKLDPRLLSGKGLEGVEKTLVEFKLRGDALSLSRFTLLTQQKVGDRAILVERAELTAAPNLKLDEARLDVTLLAAHLHPRSPAE